MSSEPFALSPVAVALSQLYLDPANPRLSTVDDPEGVGETAYNDCYALEAATQNDLQEKLRADSNSFSDLINKIRSQGFLPIDRIVVRRAQCAETSVNDAARYIVLEGNRRVAALKAIQSSPTVNLLGQPIRSTLDPIEVLLYQGEDPQVAWKIQGLRHISGVREWGAFQRARYLHEMLEGQGLDIEDLHQTTGYRVSEVRRYVNAYIGFMQAHGLRPEIIERDFSFFQEAIFAGGAAGANLLKWLAWDEEAKKFIDVSNLSTLLDLIKGDGEGQEPEVIGALDLRNKFAKLLAEPYAGILAPFLAGELALDEADIKRKEQAAATSAKQDEAALATKRSELEAAFNSVDSLPIGKIRRADRADEFADLLRNLALVCADQVGLLAPEEPVSVPAVTG